MTIYKLIRITQYYNTLKYRIYCYDTIVNVVKAGKDYVVEEWGNVVRPVFDSMTNRLIGFIDA